jgi:hypothetical protein
MKRKALLTALVITAFTGCKVQQSCDAYSLQCDELYRDYNCDIQPRILTTPQYPTTYAPVPWYYYNNAYRCDFYGNPLQSNEYMTRDINGRPIVGNVTSPNPPNTNRPRPSIYHNHGNNSGNNGANNSNLGVHRKPQNNMPSSRKTRD